MIKQALPDYGNRPLLEVGITEVVNGLYHPDKGPAALFPSMDAAVPSILAVAGGKDQLSPAVKNPEIFNPVNAGTKWPQNIVAPIMVGCKSCRNKYGGGCFEDLYGYECRIKTTFLEYNHLIPEDEGFRRKACYGIRNI